MADVVDLHVRPGEDDFAAEDDGLLMQPGTLEPLTLSATALDVTATVKAAATRRKGRGFAQTTATSGDYESLASTGKGPGPQRCL